MCPVGEAPWRPTSVKATYKRPVDVAGSSVYFDFSTPSSFDLQSSTKMAAQPPRKINITVTCVSPSPSLSLLNYLLLTCTDVSIAPHSHTFDRWAATIITARSPRSLI